MMKKEIFAVVMCFLISALCIFTACGQKNDKSISRKDIEGRENEAEELVQEYLDKKYGDIFTVSSAQLRPENNEIIYAGEPQYLVHAHYKDNQNKNLIIINVMPKRSGKSIKLYVDSDTYYGSYICDKMRKWFGIQLESAGISEYFVHFHGAGNPFPADYPTDISAEELLKKYPKDKGYLSPFKFTVEVPESDYKKYTDEPTRIVEIFDGIGADIEIEIRTIADDEYYAEQPENQELRNSIEKLTLIEHQKPAE